MVWTRLGVVLLAACATPAPDAAPAPAAAATPAPPHTAAAALCARSSDRIEVRREWDKAILTLKRDPVATSERVFYWDADLAASVHAIAVSDRAPKECALLENCHVMVLVDCGDGYAVKLGGGPSPSVRPEANPARFAAGQWLDLISIERSRDAPDLSLRTRWLLDDASERSPREVDCPTVDAGSTRLSAAGATPLKALDLQPGKRLPPGLLPGETFRIPLGPLATYNPVRAIGYVEPGKSAGIVFTTGDCVLNEWSYAFGGLGVDLVLDPAPTVPGRNGSPRALLLVKAVGTSRRAPGDSLDTPLASHRRELVFAVDERRAALVADTDTEAGEQVMYTRLEAREARVWLVTTRANQKEQRRLYDARAGEFEPAR
jgi:hypothetical protein